MSPPTPWFCKPRTVPSAVQEDLNQAYDVGIAKGIWKPVTFNEYGTPVVPVRKQSQLNQPSGDVRVCGDYSVFSNGQLETHRQPMPLPEDLMRGFKDSRIQINLFATTNTFCYGINKQDIQYMYKTN